MAVNNVTLPLGEYLDAVTGLPLSAGKVYIGTINTDPTIEANRITVNIVNQNGSTTPILPAEQPFRVSTGGKLTYNGSVLRVTAAVDYSIAVHDSNDAQKYYIPNSAEALDTTPLTIDAANVTYDPAFSSLTATDVQAAFDELTNKIFSSLYGVGAFFFGVDPNGILPGTWTQVPEGTFLMSTLGGDLSGGANSKVLVENELPAHVHAIPHDHFIASTTPSNGKPTVTATTFVGVDGGQNSSNREYNLTGDATLIDPSVGLSGDTNTADSASTGLDAGFDNRPLYIGVEIWERTV